MSGIRQVLSKNGLSGPYRRKMTNQRPPLPVVIQLFSWPAGTCGAKVDVHGTVRVLAGLLITPQLREAVFNLACAS